MISQCDNSFDGKVKGESLPLHSVGGEIFKPLIESKKENES